MLNIIIVVHKMTFSGGNSKDILETVHFQEQQLSRYKTRLKDLIIAHKNLVTEKERLEETLRNVTSIKLIDEVSSSNSSEENSERTINDLKIKITKLAELLSISSTEKCQMESQFLQERKELLQENSQLKAKIKTLSSSSENANSLQHEKEENQITRLNFETHQKELEFSSTIRELQKVVNDERKKKEKKKVTIENLEDKLRELEEKYNASKNYENELLVQLNEVKKQSENRTATSTTTEKLKNELQLMKYQYDNVLQQEQMRALKAEEKIRKLAVKHESRVSKLEQKLAQLSNLASEYDKHRQDDQQVIMKLKNRLMQLEIENSSMKCEYDRISVNEESFIQHLQHIKQHLLQNCKTSDQLNNLKEILLESLEYPSESDLMADHETKIKLKQLEEHQQKINENLNHDNIVISKYKIHNFKDRIMELESLNSRLQKEIEIERENAIKSLEEERELWKSKVNILDSDFRNKLVTMEYELEKQRERVTRIVNEKEKQLQRLQQQFFPVYQFSDDASLDANMLNRGIYKQQNCTLIYYLEDAARKEAEIIRLRKINNELQLKIHNTEKAHYHQIQLYTKLQEDVQGLEKQPYGTEELNTRYLKNVFLNYLITVDSDMRSHMLNALFAILKFTSLEINCVMKQQK